MVKQCIADLNIVVDPNKAKGEEETLIPVHILLIDHSTRKVHVPSSSTLMELREVVSEQLHIHHSKDFSFFQLADGLGHRLLPDNTVLAMLSKKWTKLKEVTGKSSHLLYKRRFMRVDETLLPGDLMHATLTYRQALWDYLHYPVPEDTKHISEIAAAILAVDPEEYEEVIQNKRLYDPKILEMLIPECSLDNQTRKKWSIDILEQYREIDVDAEAQDPRLVKMSRVLSMLQQMKLFGAYYWIGTEQSEIPPDRSSVQGAPSKFCIINPKDRNADYWICVDLFGVRFVSADSKAGAAFQRGFLFNEEAVERVLGWGGKHDIVQFVVSSLPLNEAASAGTVPMTIALQTPAAIDIAYTIHMVRDSRHRM